MKHFDFQYATHLLARYGKDVVSADLGMDEDWFSTAEPIWKNGAFLPAFSALYATNPSSTWATPTIRLHYTDGTSGSFACGLSTPA